MKMIPGVGHAAMIAVTAMAISFACVCHVYAPRVEKGVSSTPAHRSHYMDISLIPIPFSSSGSTPHHP